MKLTKRKQIFPVLFICFFISVFGSSTVFAARYYFVQNFTDNGRIYGYFEGEDLSGDGKIFRYSDEFTNFHMDYLGNYFLKTFNCYSCGNLPQNFEYDIASNTLTMLDSGYRNESNGFWGIDYSVDSASGSLWAGHFLYDGDLLPIDEKVFTSIEPLIISQIPLLPAPIPDALLLFLSGIPVLSLIKRKKLTESNS